MRGGPSGIAAESLAYSVLLFSEPFAAWRERRPRRGPDADAAPRVGRGAADADAASRVALDQLDGTWKLALTRPAKHNAFDARMREELCDALDAIATAPPAPVLLVGTGPSFCSGGDLDEFGTAASPVAAHLVRGGRSVARRLQRLGPRLVAAVHGHCVGAGVEFAAFATRVLAATTATFALPELTLGLGLGAGGSVSIPARIGRHRTLELLMRPSSIDATTALAWGLVDELVEPERLRARALEVAEAMA
jgi:enoyl-CoA hydratase/carnithine racemase